MTTTSKQKPGRARTGEPASVRTLERGLLILVALKEFGRAPLGQLARQVGLSSSTAYRLLETLRQQGFVEWDGPSGVYSVGLRAYQVGLAFTERSGLIHSAHPEMEALVGRLNETVNLAVLHAPEAIYVHQVEGRQLVRMFARQGDSAPLHASGVGKALLAWRPDADLLVGEEPFVSYTPHTQTTLAALVEELAQVRDLGYSIDDQERELGVRCVAVPVRDHTRAVVAALSVSAPTARLPTDQIPEVASQLVRAAAQISLRLGWR
ncbi:IclR family transcriptional regulator [Deinococcus sp. KSM4-11]|uniref:IclR family transcriptional regulator n=1 Tax=Deinococcus sp. KSM4-11 TaxID=2568654 RepID=UPI0010A5779F|nr:IclR family transcriptional regulator [Deinococcus sp. KSM4-11]THF84312.1 IclR family transcriptional regulator [Deinococcus sp. KSM4-11]